MKKVLITLAIIFTSLPLVMASNNNGRDKDNSAKCTITGTIVDKVTGEPLSGVEIKMIDSDQKIYTDLDGKFEIKDITAGNHSFLINYISYQEYVENVELEKGNSKAVSIELKSVEK